MDFGGYCLEGSSECYVMVLAAFIATIDVLRLIGQLVFRSISPHYRTSYSIIPRRGLRVPREWFLLLGALILLAISAFQTYWWIAQQSGRNSVVLLQLSAINIASSLLGGAGIAQDSLQRRSVSSLTRMSFGVNLLSNILVAMVATRSQDEGLLNNDNTYFYAFLFYLFAACVLQVLFIRQLNQNQPSLLEGENISTQINNEAILTQTTQRVDTNMSSAVTCGENLLITPIKPNEAIKEPLLFNDRNIPPNNRHLIGRIPVAQLMQGINQPPRSAWRQNAVSNDDLEERKVDSGNAQDNEEQADSSDEFGRVGNVRIDRFLETIKYEKKTIVYEVKCTYRGRINTVKRSFREFGALNAAMKAKYRGTNKLPAFPAKKGQNAILTFIDIEDRKKLLSVYLQEIVKICNSAEIVDFFTLVNQSQQGNAAPYTQEDGQETPPNKQRTFSGCGISPPSGNLSVPEIIWEEDEELCHSASSNYKGKSQ